jgi:uncharacterized protein
MLVVADTSALLALAACDALTLLGTLFDEVRVPPAVFGECTISGKPRAAQLEVYLRDKVAEVSLADLVIAVAGLGQGELEAMALYKRLHADRLLVDDDRARRVARLNGISVVGSVGVLLSAKERLLIESIRPRLERIRSAGIRLGEEIFLEALRLANET